MKMRFGCLIWLLAILSALRSCRALFEDQAGLWDWHQQLVGRVKFARFHTYGSKKRVLVATDSNALASLNLRTGDIVWRKLLATTDSVDQLEAHGKYLFAVSKASCTVRAWTMADGILAWETVGMGMPARSSSGCSIAHLRLLPVDVDGDGMSDVAILFEDVVHVLSSIDGRILWQHTLIKDSAMYYQIHVEKERIFAIGIGADQKSVQVTVLDAKSGNELNAFTAPASELLQPSSLSLGGSTGVIAVTSVSGAALYTGTILASSLELERTPVKDLAGPGAHSAEILPLALEGAFALSAADSVGAVAVVQVAAGDARPSVLGGPGGRFPLSESTAVSSSVDLGEGTGHVFGVVASAPDPGTTSLEVAVIRFSVMGLGGGAGASMVENEVVMPWTGRGRVASVFLNVYPRKDGGNGFRALVVGDDDSLALLQQGEVVWVREEGLASILGVQMVDLPLPHGGEAHRSSSKAGGGESSIEHNVQEWLKDQWVQAKVALILATEEEKARVAKQRQSGNEKTAMTSDHNGFRKLIVAATRAGKVYALHNGDGRVVWSTFPSPFAGSALGGKAPEVLRLFLSRVPHRSALDAAPTVLLLSRARGSGSDAAGILTTLDAHTGAQLDTTHLPFAVKQAIQLPYVDASETRLLLLVDSRQRAHVFPSSADSARALAPHVGTTFFYEVEPSGRALSGYALVPNEGGERGEAGAVFETEKIWSLVFAEDAEVVATVAARRPDEVAHALTKVLGNRDVLYKYLNRNTIFVATVTPAKDGAPGSHSQMGGGGPASGGDDASTLTAYIIDAVTGQVLYRVLHAGMQGPVHAVLSENWVVYHYFSVRQHRFEVSVLELYDEDALQAEKSVLSIIKDTVTGSGSSSHNASFLSSFSAPALRVLGQSYYFSRSVKVLAVTVTGKGITGKHVLFGTGTDQVLAMEKRYLDPRRPTTAPSNSDREEGLIPYGDTLPIIATSYLTQNKAVEGLRGITTVPARLESSSLVFVYGLDLFYSRTSPSRDYDTLGEDFSFSLLLGTFVILLLGIPVTWILGTRRELHLRWQ